MLRRHLLLALLCSGALAACDNAIPDAAADEGDAVRQHLVGSWLREYEEDGTHVRRVITLEQDGTFREFTKIVQADGVTTQMANGGEWFFDGINLKRKYTSFDGTPHSHTGFTYATFALKSWSKFEFVGVDNVRRREIRYQRVDAGTLP
jgi:hypothetical protein